MAKPKPMKASGSGPESSAPPPLPNRDVFHRINFAYQAAAFLHQLTPAGSPSSGVNAAQAEGSSVSDEGRRKGKRKAKGGMGSVAKVAVKEGRESGASAGISVDWSKLARKGTKEMKRMAVHTQVKIDPSVKRAICKTCSTVLIPGLTCRVRNRPSKSHTHITHYTCLACQAIRSIPNPPLNLEGPPPTAPILLGNTVQKKRSIKAAFHEREQIHTLNAEGQGVQGVGAGQRGHGLWRGDNALKGWGAVPLPDTETAS